MRDQSRKQTNNQKYASDLESSGSDTDSNYSTATAHSISKAHTYCTDRILIKINAPSVC